MMMDTTGGGSYPVGSGYYRDGYYRWRLLYFRYLILYDDKYYRWRILYCRQWIL
jgi:hypothetical protein